MIGTNSPAQLILPDLDAIDRHALGEPPQELRQFARQSIFQREVGHERRRHRRYNLITNVLAIPVNNRLQPCGQPFVALSWGISVGGIRLIHTRPSPSEFLFVEVEWREGRPTQSLLEVLRNRPVSRFFEIAGRLVDVVRRTDANETVIFSAADDCPVVEAETLADTGMVRLLSVEEAVQWAGLTAALEILKAESSGHLWRG